MTFHTPPAAIRSSAERIARGFALALGGSLLLVVSAKVQVPFYPVPLTLQTLVVLLLGATLGARLAAASVALYLIEGLAGLPVFAGAVAGPVYMAGPTGGFLVGFLAAAALTGFVADRRWDRSWIRLLASLSLGHAMVFAFGFLWLAQLIGAQKAFAAGVAPFVLATIVKTSARRGAGRRGQERARANGPRLRPAQVGMAADPDRHGPPSRTAFARFVSLATRWSDNDAYGHLNNVVYYALFDSAVNAILIEAGLLDPASSPIIGLVVESNCRFYASLTYPDLAEVGVAVEHLGRSSVRYHLAVFKAAAKEAAAAGRYTHVYVERATNRPIPIPEGHRRLMEGLKAL